MIQAVGGELGRHAAPGKAQSGADHRQHGRRLAHDAHQVGQERERGQSDEHECDRLVARLRFAAFGSAESDANDTKHDRRNGDSLALPSMLAEHAPAEEEQHEQPSCKRRLHDHERRKQQRHDLQRPAEDRQPGPEQPARSHNQVACEPEAQVHLVRGTLGVHRL